MLHKQGYVLAMTGSAVEKDSAAMQNDFSEGTPTGLPMNDKIKKQALFVKIIF